MVAHLANVGTPGRLSLPTGRDAFSFLIRLLGALGCEMVGMTRGASTPDHGVIRAAGAQPGHATALALSIVGNCLTIRSSGIGPLSVVCLKK